MQKLPQSLDLRDYSWSAGRIVKQFMSTSVLDAEDIFRTMAAGMVEVVAVVDEDTDSKISIVAPIIIKDEAKTYSEAWGGDLAIDKRQRTHMVLTRFGDILETRHISEDIDSIEVLYCALFANQKNRDNLNHILGYEKAYSFIDIDKDHEYGVLELPGRFFSTVHTTARQVFSLVKETGDLIQHGGRFAHRGDYTQYILLLTYRKRWVLCVRTSDTEELLPIEGVINDVIRTFDYDQEDEIINYFLESGFDPLDPDIDDMNEVIAKESLNDG